MSTASESASFEIIPQASDTLVALGLRFRLLDVREDHECATRPIVSDYHIPFSRFDAGELLLMQPTDPLLVICSDGERSLAIVLRLRREGWPHSHSLAGGLDALNAARETAQTAAA
jgi:rhodanese-related sulfurtransferase